jgi:ATP dependent DNA ligase domain
VPSGGYAYEVKWDEFRAIVSTVDQLRVRSRRGWDMTELLPELSELLSRLVLDGELVAWGDDGRPSFPRLCDRILHGKRGIPVTFMIFDLLAESGRLALDRPYDEQRLRRLLPEVRTRNADLGGGTPMRSRSLPSQHGVPDGQPDSKPNRRLWKQRSKRQQACSPRRLTWKGEVRFAAASLLSRCERPAGGSGGSRPVSAARSLRGKASPMSADRDEDLLYHVRFRILWLLHGLCFDSARTAFVQPERDGRDMRNG